MTAQVVALCNQKGGVGKTTTAFQLLRAAALSGLKVLGIDGDPQGSLTKVAAREIVLGDQAGLADVLSARAPETIRDVVVPGLWPGVDIVPTSGATLGVVRDELVVAGAGREQRLRQALTPVLEDFDLVLIDCAPSLDQLTINALAAADGVAIVTHTKLFASDGLSQLLETIDSVRAFYNPSLRIAGVVVNQHEERTISGKTWLDELKAAAAERHFPVLSPPIPKRVVISDATEAAQGVDEWGSEGVALGKLYADHFANITNPSTWQKLEMKDELS